MRVCLVMVALPETSPTDAILQGHCIDHLREMPAQSVQCVVTSPPYFGLRDYGNDAVRWGDGWLGCLGNESTPPLYVAHMLEVFTEVWRVLRKDGTLWLNLGDSYAAGGHGWGGGSISEKVGHSKICGGAKPRIPPAGFKKKDLLGIPWRVAFALQDAGWYLRSDIIWSKKNCMPESVTDRPTRSHEYLFLLTKSERYFYDADAIREEALQPHGDSKRTGQHKSTHLGHTSRTSTLGTNYGTSHRNKRSVWDINTAPFSGAHYAVMPEELARTCILAGSRPGDGVLDPFGGRGTVGKVARAYNRHYTLIEQNAASVAMAHHFIHSESYHAETPSATGAPSLWDEVAP